MNRKWVLGLIALSTMSMGVGPAVMAQSEVAPLPATLKGGVARRQTGDQQQTASRAEKAIDEASQAGKYTFVFFYKDQEEATQATRRSFAAAVEKFADRAAYITVNVQDPAERLLVGRYGVARSPMPLVLALAPNGAVTKSYTDDLGVADLESAFVSPAAQQSLKALQDRKLVFICVQNEKTQHNVEAMLGVRDFAADPQYAARSEIITLDPADPAEKSFLETLRVEPATAEAVTVLMAPPGTIVGTYTGATSKVAFAAAAKGAAKGCDPRSGCCPPKKPAKDSGKNKP